MKDLLKEAIADAKAVKQTALANAKLALEEAFTPRLQSMLSAKLAEELSDDDEEVDDVTMEGDEEGYVDNEAPVEEGEGEEDYSEEEMTEEEEGHSEEEMTEEEDDLDLEEIIRELEGEDSEEVEEPTMDEEDEYSDEEPMEEGEGDDEDIDINEIIRSLREEDEDEEDAMERDTEDEAEEESSEELEEAYNVIRFLKGKINEVNLLNAKLLYSNKLFRNFVMNEGQKMKVIENFDRAHNLREVKLVYTTLAEGFKAPSTRKSIKESYASKPIASTKPAKRVLSEGADLANRFQKLAGLKK